MKNKKGTPNQEDKESLSSKFDPKEEIGGLDRGGLTEKEFKEAYREEGIKALKEKNAKLKEEVRTLRENRELRREYAEKTFWLITMWLIGLFIALLFNNLIWIIQENVLIALVTTTTINITGIFYFVMRYLFSEKALSGENK